MVKSGDEDQAFAVCSLREGGTESVAVDLALEEYSEFTVVGDAPIHLTGYFMPLDDEDDDGDDGLMPDYGEDDSDFDMDFDDDPSLLGYDESGLPIYDGDGGSSDDDSEDGDGDSEDDDSGDDSSDDDGPPRGNVAQIKDVTDGASDDSGESGESGSEESDDSESESESEEEEPPAPQPKKQKAAPPAKKEQPPAKKEQPPAKKEQPPAKKKQEDVIETKTKAKKYPNGFEIHELKQGKASGKVAKAGKQVTMKYVGRLTNGKVFDQTKGKSTFKFRLGVGEVIKGWDRGVEGMRVGDSRKLVCPPSMAYGSSRTGPIPPNSTLVFEVELVDVR